MHYTSVRGLIGLSTWTPWSVDTLGTRACGHDDTWTPGHIRLHPYRIRNWYRLSTCYVLRPRFGVKNPIIYRQYCVLSELMLPTHCMAHCLKSTLFIALSSNERLLILTFVCSDVISEQSLSLLLHIFLYVVHSVKLFVRPQCVRWWWWW